MPSAIETEVTEPVFGDPPKNKNGGGLEFGGRPTVLISKGALPWMLDGLTKAFHGVLYEGDTGLVRIVRKDGVPHIEDMSVDRLREIAAAEAKIVRVNKDDEHVAADPPDNLLRSYIARAGRGLPRLRGISAVPLVGVDRPGYDEATGVFFDPMGVEFPTVPEEPSREEAEAALARLDALVKDFPFVDDASRSAALAMMLTTVARPLLRTAPMFGIDAPTMGTGKSLLADVVSIMLTGRDAAAVSQGASEEEDEKRLLAKLRAGAPLVVVDNISRPVEGDSLCTILTSDRWEGRILGRSEMVSVSTRAMFVVTGNNLEFRGDMRERALMIRLDAEMENPGEREFDVDLRVFAKANRAQLVADAMTVLKAHRAPVGIPVFGRFEEWSALVREQLVWLGRADPYETRRTVLARDTEGEDRADILEALEGEFGLEREITAAMILDAIEGPDDEFRAGSPRRRLEVAFRRNGRVPDKRWIGRVLAKMVDVPTGGRRLERRAYAKSNNASRYVVVDGKTGREERD